MLKKIKQWYYKYGYLITYSDEEAEAAERYIEKHDARVLNESEFMYKYIKRSIWSVFWIGELWIFRAKNADTAKAIIDDFHQECRGYTLVNPAVEELWV